MYDSQPIEREGETIEEVLPAATYTTSSTGRGHVPRKDSVREVASGTQGRIVVALSVLCAVLMVAFVVALIL
ncbi:hypothetical protein [Rubrobacter aplysinae]|uniref:hypothetical protein n=1 Tax=Rubrobacter aplysinae TaxID=909625 RepID=UPI00064C4552|nr:hypothetical protein [Rubrobacter aplysinae]